MRVLFVAALTHPEVLQAESAATPAGQAAPLFPTSTAEHWLNKALRERGHSTAVFYRNLPTSGDVQFERYQDGLTFAKLTNAVMRRIPSRFNPEYRRRNQRLIEQARGFKPDAVWMMGGNSVITPETLATIKRELGCKLIYLAADSPLVFGLPIERRAAPLLDWVLCNDEIHGREWVSLGAQRMECLPISACDPAFHHPYDLSEAERRAYQCDVAFVGTLIPDKLYSQRVGALESLRDFDLGIWSVHDVPPSLKGHLRGSALGETMLKVFSAAKITINVHGDSMRDGGNMRLFEAAGVGILQIADHLPGNLRWFSESETIVTFTDGLDLREKVAYYLVHADERRALTERARRHVYAQHTYTHRIARIEQLLAESCC